MERAKRRRKFAESLPIVATTAAAILGAPAPARAQAPAPAAQAPHWNVNHGEVYCTLGRDNGPGAVNFALRAIPGTERVELLVTSRGWDRAPATYGQTVRIAFAPGGGDPVEARTVAGRLPGGAPVIAFLELGSGFVDRFAQARRLQVTRGSRDLLTLDFPNADRAVATLRECFARRLADWGLDVAAQARMRSLPKMIGMPFSNSDYPSAALRADAQGVAIVRLMIGTEGRVTDCAVLRTSGTAVLDARTCQVFLRDGRYQPAIGEDGQPVATGAISTVIWGIRD